VEVDVAATDQRVSSAAAAVSANVAAVTDDVVSYLTREIPALRADRRVLGLLSASVAENVTTLLHVFEHGIDPLRVEAPAAAIEYARRLAQRGIPMVALVRAYRIGQARFLRWCFDELARQCGEGAELGGATRRLTELSFAYIDRISEQVIVIYEQERDRWLRNRATVRAACVRAVLEEREVDVDAAETTLGYRLRRRHLGLVAWVDEATGADQDLNRLERATVALGERVGAHAKPLFVPCDESSAWAWLALASDPSSDDAIPDAVEDSGIRAAFGEPGAGVDGFRRTHRQALMAERVALTARRPGRQVIAFGDIGPVALMSSDLAQLRAWVRETLGALATDDEQHARLRTTVRVFLETGRSYTATAERLTMHKNTVHYRINKAEEIRGRPLGADRLGVEVALLACEQLGPGVLQR
jgi:hypothetical protein